MVNSTLIIQRTAPYGCQFAKESLDLALGFAVMDCDVAMLFVDDGVYQLLKQQAPAEQKSLAKNFAALPLYGIEQLFCDNDSLTGRGIRPEQLIDGVTLLDASNTRALIAKAARCFAL